MPENDLAARRRFDELLPWYVNGTLPAPESEWVGAYMQQHPEAVTELRWWEGVQERVRDDVPAVSPDVGYERLLARIGTATAAAGAKAAAGAPAEGTAVRPGRWWSWLSGWGLTPRFAFATALIVLQAGVIGKLLLDRPSPGPYSDIREVPGQARVAGTLMKVSFKPDARESDVRLLLVSIGGSIVDGPSQLGDYVVNVPNERAAAAGQALVASGFVEGVTVLGVAAR